ncbi:recombinase RecT [Desulfitobacterium metallireducens]|uniref:Phage recombination protein Bet n=1 Tax=Desulfitobacterium metallireducens DSM 15288 TaxID=871968 RepID=W0ECX3_9FIRM|nr:recombinase RecT [Desulfitobacterium metallireducens]AHF08617.1 hypothetical protein DESME_09715 [Desulfitobacterium metallireducens DSM 15288]
MAITPNPIPAQDGSPIPSPDDIVGELARRKIYAGIPDDDVALALALCQKYGFDPLLKHLVLLATKDRDETTGQGQKHYNAYVTRDGLLHVAHTSGMLDGLETIQGKDDLGEWAEAVVYRKDMSRPFRYRVYLSEYVREAKGVWKTHPQAMLTKTAEVFALRRAFDVALTPFEEMGFDNQNIAGDTGPSPKTGFTEKAGFTGNTDFSAEASLPGKARFSTEAGLTDMTVIPPNRVTGSIPETSRLNTSAGSTGRQRRQLF